MIKAITEAWSIWHDSGRVSSMIKNWEGDVKKHDRERLIADWVGSIDSVADLGCGNGRLSSILDCSIYHGFDASPEMLRRATNRLGNVCETRKETFFYECDIFSPEHPGANTKYGVALIYDVAIHQLEPVEAVLEIMSLWQAERYIFTLFFGDRREDLLLTTIEPFSNFLKITDATTISRLCVERHDGCEFASFFVEVTKT